MAATAVFLCGGECAEWRHWTSSNGAVAPSFPATGRNGGRSIRFDTTAQAANLTWALANPTTAVIRCYVKFPGTLPATTQDFLFGLGPNSGVSIGIGFTQSTGRLHIGLFGGTKTAGPVVVADTWYRVDLRANCITNPWVADWYVDGALQTQVSPASAGTSWAHVELGDNGGATTRAVEFDDVVASITSGDFPIGDGTIVGFAVNTTSGTHNQTTGDLKTSGLTNLSDGDSSGGNLNEAGPSDLSSYVEQTVARSTTYAEYLYATSGETRSPRAVQQIVVVSNVVGTVANNEKSQLFDGVGAADAYALTNVGSTSRVTRNKTWLTAPSGSAWSAALFQAARLRWGFATTVGASVPFITRSLLEAEFDVIAPAAPIAVLLLGGL